MHTGQHGLYFNSEAITQDVFLEQVSQGLKTLAKTIKNQFQKKIRIIGFKDYFENDAFHSSTNFFKKEKLYKAQAQPNMIFEVNGQWPSPEDYISAFNKKYRRRYKTARKKGQHIIRKELSLEDVSKHSEALYKLYENVSDNAGVNSFKLHENTFFRA